MWKKSPQHYYLYLNINLNNRFSAALNRILKYLFVEISCIFALSTALDFRITDTPADLHSSLI